jgi:hypothetical protein
MIKMYFPDLLRVILINLDYLKILCPIHPEKLMAVSYKEFIIDS